MKKKNVTPYCSLGAAAFAGAVMLMAANATAQNLFVSTYDTGNVYQITPGGTPTVFTSGLNYPTGLAFDSAGDLFIGNSGDNIAPGSITEITAGGTTSTFGAGLDPIGLAVNSSGILFEADYNSGNVYEFSNGVATPFATGFSTPISLTFDSAGNLYVGSGYGDGNGVITKITPGGTQSLFASGLSFPNGMAFNSAGDLFVSSQDNGIISEYGPGGGTPSTFVTLSEASLNGLAFDNAGDLFAAANNGDIVKITGGTPSLFANVSGISEELAFAPVPEPSAMALAALGGVALIFRRRKTN